MNYYKIPGREFLDNKELGIMSIRELVKKDFQIEDELLSDMEKQIISEKPLFIVGGPRVGKTKLFDIITNSFETQRSQYRDDGGFHRSEEDSILVAEDGVVNVNLAREILEKCNGWGYGCIVIDFDFNNAKYMFDRCIKTMSIGRDSRTFSFRETMDKLLADCLVVQINIDENGLHCVTRQMV